MTMALRLAHVVFQTNKLAEMRDWYAQALGAEVVFEDERFCFMSHDEEHHRIAFLNLAPLDEREPPRAPMTSGNQPGLHHVAFTFSSLDELFDNYDRLKVRGIIPFFCINHGPTTSMYYRDPDGNTVELQIDNYPTAEQGKAWLKSAAFKRNPVGVPYDPEALKARHRAGVPLEELVTIE
jgi:catechol-2,3-dioxygenase